MGLSPRVRGSLTLGMHGMLSARSIPASAGQPRPPRLQLPPPRVYPRECGAALLIQRMRTMVAGLSPRVRGSHPSGDTHAPGDGSIPASAGQPIRRSPGGRRAGVYPRECGAARPPLLSIERGVGLSPRVRGSRDGRDSPGAPQRSIPASAGQPVVTQGLRTMRQVYPRECGAASSDGAEGKRV